MKLTKLDIVIRVSFMAFFIGAAALLGHEMAPRSGVVQLGHGVMSRAEMGMLGTFRTTDLVVDNTATADGGKRIFDDPGTALARDGVSPNKINLSITPTTCGAGMAEVSTAADGTSACAAFAPGGSVSGALNTIAMFTPDGLHVGNSIITQSGTTDTVTGKLAVKTSAQAVVFSSYNGSSGTNNVWIGTGGNSDTSGAGNSALGVGALFSNTTGTSNVSVGLNSLALNADGSSNSAIGAAALNVNTSGFSNTAIGASSLNHNTTGHENTAAGISALSGNTVGAFNTALGTNAMIANTTGTHNIAIGTDSLSTNTTGSFIIAIGLHALQDLLVTDASNNYNLAIGYNTARGIITGTNNTIIGHNITGLAAGLSGQIIIADGQGNQRISIDSSGNVATSFGGPKNKGSITLSAGTGTATVLSGAKCVCTDSAGTAGAPVAVSCVVSGTTLTANGIGTDAITYLCL